MGNGRFFVSGEVVGYAIPVGRRPQKPPVNSFALKRPTIRAAVTPLAYQFPAPAANSLDAALAAHLFGDHPWLGDWLPADSPIVEAYRIALAHLTMAREQLLFELLAAELC